MLSNAIKNDPLFTELRDKMREKYGVMDAELAMCFELIELNKMVVLLNERMAKLETELDKETHRAFHRLPPIDPISHPSKVPTVIPPPSIDDDWVSTGRETEAA